MIIMRFQLAIERGVMTFISFLRSFYKFLAGRLNFTILLYISLGILVASVIFTTTLTTKLQMTNGDQFISGAIFGNMANGTPMISASHTNLLKLPLLVLEGVLPQNFTLYVFINSLIIIVAVLLWAILIGRVLGRKIIPLTLLCFAALLMSSPTLSVNLSMLTIRHIEYPLSLIYILLIMKFIRIQKYHLIFASLLALYLAALLINDNFFLYTLVPTSLIGTLFYIHHKGKGREVTYSIVATLGGVVLSLVITKLINLWGVISMVSGYANAHEFISFHDLGQAISLTISQTLDLFGAFLFGSEIRKQDIIILLGMVILGITVYGMVASIKNKHQNNYTPLTKAYLPLFTLFIYLAYILPGFANPNNVRYITGIVFIGTTYFSLGIIYLSRKNQFYYSFAFFFLILLTVIAIPRAVHAYQDTAVGINRDIARTKLTSQILKSNDVSTVVTGGGHFSLWFYSDKKINIVQLENSCNTPSPWANNSSWLAPAPKSRSAFLVDLSYPEHANRVCGIDRVSKIYGTPEKIVPVPKPGETSNQVTTFLLLYNYDIRTKLR